MCSRQVFENGNVIAEALGLRVKNAQEGSDNSAPTDVSPIITLQEPNDLQYFSWGFPWIETSGKYALTTCIRSETAYTKYSRLFKVKKRCLSVSKGFYEFSKSVKEPFFFTVTDQPYTFIAGLWDSTPDIDTGEYRERYAILTVQPNEMVAKTHDRMPVILTPEEQAIWLDPNSTDEQLISLFKPYEADKMDAKIASRKVNSSKNKNFKLDKLIDPDDRPVQGSLFD